VQKGSVSVIVFPAPRGDTLPPIKPYKINFWRLFKNESGTTTIEYGLIVTILSVIAIGSMIAIGGSVAGFFANASAGLR